MPRVLLAAVALLLCPSASAQSSTPASNSPGRLVYVIPNNRTVERPKAFAPIKVGTKFKLSAEDAFDPFAFISAGVNAGVEQAARDHQQYGQGAAGFGKRYGADFADEAMSESLSGECTPVYFVRIRVISSWNMAAPGSAAFMRCRALFGPRRHRGARIQQFKRAGRLFGRSDLESVLPRGRPYLGEDCAAGKHPASGRLCLQSAERILAGCAPAAEAQAF
jgi:hypothetical protein